jgi:arylsulfatase A-like enzyme
VPGGPPNIILINTDDMASNMVGYMPVLNRELVQQGTTFANSFVTTALCCPSRSSVFSGQYAHNHGVHFNSGGQGGFNAFDDSSTIATWLHDAGYRTALYGKYLNGYDGSVRPGWDDFHASPEPGFFDYQLYENGVLRSYGSNPEDYSTDVLARKSVDFIRANEAVDDQPFFLYVGTTAPHKPAIPAPRHRNTLQGLTPHRPPSFNEANISDKPQWVQTPLLTASEVAQMDQRRQAAIESMLSVDEAIASIIDSLRVNGELERTVILFTSDNGLLFGEHRQYGKRAAYEESIRVPLIVRDGRNLTSRTVQQIALNIDLAPTLAELAGVPIPATVDGRSLAPFLSGASIPWRTDFLIENWSHELGEEHIALRTDRWMYAEYINGDRELYDLLNDPHELNSLHNNPTLASTVSEFSARLRALESCQGATCS